MSFASTASRFSSTISSFLGITRRATDVPEEDNISRKEILWLIGALASSQNASPSKARSDLLLAARVLQKRLGKPAARAILEAAVPTREGPWLLTASSKPLNAGFSLAEAERALKVQARASFIYQTV